MTADYMRKLELDLDVANATVARLEFERDNLLIAIDSYAETIGKLQALADKGLPIRIGGRRYVSLASDALQMPQIAVAVDALTEIVRKHDKGQVEFNNARAALAHIAALQREANP